MSYAREDLVFVDQLVDALAAVGFEPLIDRGSMVGGQEFQEHLAKMILECDTVAFVLSPDSISPESFCTWEVAEADRQSRRMIPVLCRPLHDAVVPPRLQKLDYIFFYPEPHVPGSGFGNGLARLITALNADLDWLREHSLLGQRATLWDRRGRDEASLLRGTLLVDAEKILANRPVNAPEITELQLAYINASRQAEDASTTAERQRLAEMSKAQEEREKANKVAEEALQSQKNAQDATRRVQRKFSIALAFSALFLILAAGAALYQIKANNIRETQLFANQAAQSSARGNYDQALRYAISAAPAPGEYWPLAGASQDLIVEMARATYASRLRGKVQYSRPLTRIACSAGGQSAVATDDLGTVVELSLDTLKNSRTLVGGEVARWLRLSSDGLQAVTASEDVLQVWATSSGKSEINWSSRKERIIALGPASSGPLVLTVSRDFGQRLDKPAVLTVRDRSASVVRTRPLNRSKPTSAALSADGEWAAMTGGDGGSLSILSMLDTAAGRTIGEGISAEAGLEIDPHGRTLVTVEGPVARVWDIATGRLLAKLEGQQRKINAARFNADGTLIVTASEDRTVRVWRISDGRMTVSIAGHDGEVNDACFVPGLDRLVTVSADGSARLWSLEERSPQSIKRSGDMKLAGTQNSSGIVRVILQDRSTHELTIGRLEAGKLEIENRVSTGQPVKMAALNPSRTKLLAAQESGGFALWSFDGAGGQAKAEFYGASSRTVIWLGFSGNDLPRAVTVPTLKRGDDDEPRDRADPAGDIEFRDLQQNESATSIPVKVGDLEGLKISNTGHRVAMLTDQGGVKVVSLLASGDTLPPPVNFDAGLENGTVLAFSADGAFVATANADGRIQVWDWRHGRSVSTVFGAQQRVEAAAFSSDLSLLALKYADGPIALLDIATSREVGRLPGGPLNVAHLAFAKGGREVATISNGGESAVWDLGLMVEKNSEVLQAAACKDVLKGGDRFSASERTSALLRDGDLDVNLCARQTVVRQAWTKLTSVFGADRDSEVDEAPSPSAPNWGSVTWASDAQSMDYGHLDTALSGSVFELTADDLDLLIRANHFEPIKTDGRVLFALRGAALATPDNADEHLSKEGISAVDQTSLALREVRPNHKEFRCLLGVYNAGTRKLSAFTGSTVPNRKAVVSYFVNRSSGNMMPPGLYRFSVGWHLISKPERKIPGTFLEAGRQRAVLRSTNNLRYDIFDIWENTRLHGNNLHPAKSESSAQFSSWGSMVVAGNFTATTANREEGQHTGQWAQFRKAAGLAETGTGDHLKEFDLVMLTGLEGAIASSMRKSGEANTPAVVQSKLERLRPGSSGDLVKRLQKALGMEETGVFSHQVTVALAKRQTEMLGYSDGLLSRESEVDLGLCVFRDAGC